jgi:hypothetical protein
MSSPDNEGQVIVSIIILLQYNIAQNNIILQKRLPPARLGLKRAF